MERRAGADRRCVYYWRKDLMAFKRFAYIPVLFLLALGAVVKAQDLDSLKNVLKNAQGDTVKVKTLAALAEAAPDGEWEKYNEELLTLCDKKLKALSSGDPLYFFYMRNKAHSFNNTGIYYDMRGDFEMAMEFHLKSAEIREKINDRQGLAFSYNNMGAVLYYHGHLVRALDYFRRSYNLQKEFKNQQGMADALNNMGFIYQDRGDVARSLQCFNQSLDIRKEMNDQPGLAAGYNNIAGVYQSVGDISKALDFYMRSLHIREQAGDKNGMAYNLNNIGGIYLGQYEYQKAIEFCSRSLKLAREVNDLQMQGHALNKLGTIYSYKKDSLKAIEYLHQAYKIFENNSSRLEMAIAKDHLGDLYMAFGLDGRARGYFEEALQIYKEINNVQGISHCLSNLAGISFKQGDLVKARKLGEQSLVLAERLGYPGNIRKAAYGLKNTYEAMGDFSSALRAYELFVKMRDSLKNDETRKNVIKKQFQYDYEKKAAADSLLAAGEKQVMQARIKQNRQQSYFLYAGLLLTLLFAGLMIHRFRITSKQKNIIEDQKKQVEVQKLLVEQKQEDVLDSIRYARRIQQSLMPTAKYIERVLNKKD
jgi:tetratricopeptide (TPR) repeat protein